MTNEQTATVPDADRDDLVDIDWGHELIEQLDFHWGYHVRPRLDGLTDDEYLWEPAQPCWSIRRRGEERTTAAGAGDTVAEFEFPEPDPVPVTTIAWRMAHLSIGCFGMRASNHFGDGSVAYETTDWPITAAGGVALLDHWYGEWLAGIRSLDVDGLRRKVGSAEGPYAEYPFAALILHINREAIHHAAEITLLRDLYRSRVA